MAKNTVCFGLAFIALSSGCATFRAEYRATIIAKASADAEMKEHTFVYEESRPTELRLWCALTAVIDGGACWAYLGLPYEEDEERIAENGRRALEPALCSAGMEPDFTILSEAVSRVSYNEGPSTATLDGNLVSLQVSDLNCRAASGRATRRWLSKE